MGIFQPAMLVYQRVTHVFFPRGLPQVAIPLLKDITDKYVPRLISHADLWALAANVSGAENQASRCGENLVSWSLVY